MNVLERLNQLELQVLSSGIPRAEQEWGGADVIVAAQEPASREAAAFRSAQQRVVTPHALELSWVIEQLRDLAYERTAVDFGSKYEFFGRLAEAINRRLEAGSTSVEVLCVSALCEARLMFVELAEAAE